MEEKIPGTWSVHENMDLFGHFDSEYIENWEDKFSLDELKWRCIEHGKMGLSILKEKGMAVLKRTGPIKAEHLKPIEGELEQPCTFYLFTGDATY